MEVTLYLLIIAMFMSPFFIMMIADKKRKAWKRDRPLVKSTKSDVLTLAPGESSEGWYLNEDGHWEKVVTRKM